MTRLIFLGILCIFSSACVSPWPVYSSHNLDEGRSFFGGGYRLKFVEPGVYEITATTNKSGVLNPQTAREMWRDQAEKVCGSVEYIEKDINEHNIRHYIAMDLDDYQNVKTGIAICTGFANPSSYQHMIVGKETSADEFRSLISGTTASGESENGYKFHVYYAPDGTMFGLAINRNNTEYEDSGSWEITDEGQVCETWKKWREQSRNCFLTYATGDGQYQMKAIGKVYRDILVIRKGDPEGLGGGASTLRGIDLTGTYISENTGERGRYLSNYSGGEVRLIQTKNEISGSYGDTGKIGGEVVGDTIKFDWWRNGGAVTGVGQWKVNADGSELQGSWTNSGRHYSGTWNLKRIE